MLRTSAYPHEVNGQRLRFADHPAGNPVKNVVTLSPFGISAASYYNGVFGNFIGFFENIVLHGKQSLVNPLMVDKRECADVRRGEIVFPDIMVGYRV
ncbi:hypothetical protein D3C86_1575070 [compost metagenome]